MAERRGISHRIVTDKVWEELGYTATEEEAPAPPTHCRCGRALVRHVENNGFTNYGRPSQVLTWRCPATVGWWNRATLRFMGHDEYELSHFIDWHWRRRHYQ